MKLVFEAKFCKEVDVNEQMVMCSLRISEHPGAGELSNAFITYRTVRTNTP